MTGEVKTDSREILAGAFGDMSEEEKDGMDNVLRILKLTPASALALMEGKATVVPVEPTNNQVKAILTALRGEGSAGALYAHALAASPYRSDNDA